MDTEVGKKPNKKKILIICIISTTTVLLIAAVAGFFIGENYYSSHFMKGTKLNGIDVSHMTVNQINQRIQDYELVIEERDGDGKNVKETITGAQIGLTLEEEGQLEEIFESQQGGKWIVGRGQEYEIEKLTQYDEEKWKTMMDNLQCFSEDFVTEPQNAYVQEYNENDGKFQLIEEVEGNKADESKVEQVLKDAVLKLDETASLENCYVAPEITSDNQELNAFYEKLNQYANVNITYKFGEETETLSGKDICGWLTIDYDNYTVSLQDDRVTEFVNYLGWKHNTIFGTRTFMTSYGKEVTIEGGDYGWWLNREEEAAQLKAMIEEGKSGERTPVYFQEAAAYGEKDYGDTYIEINLTAQHLFLYVDGQKIMESDFVSGLPNGHETPAGTYAVTYTEKYATLRGETYETMVSYWMPFNQDIGLHDATWQEALGGNLYRRVGSHGCVNLPYNFAKALFPYVEKGMPVICYHLAGTESSSTTPQSYEEKAQSVIDAINEIPTSSKPERQIKNARTLYNDLDSGAKAKVTNYSDLLAYEAQY